MRPVDTSIDARIARIRHFAGARIWLRGYLGATTQKSESDNAQKRLAKRKHAPRRA